MKNRYIFLLLILIFMSRMYGQSGINTSNTTPSQNLQVAGVSASTQIGASGVYVVAPTIRIDGLNKANNSLAAASTSILQPVSATQDGEFILSNDFAIPLVATNLGTDELPTVVNVDAVNGLTASGIIKTYSFTLDQPSAVHFLAAISVSIYDINGSLLTDKINRIYRCVFNFTLAPSGVTINTPFARSGYSYTNGNSNGFSGSMYLQPEDYQVLPKGSYTVQLIGYVSGGTTNAPITSVRGTFGEGGSDMVNITAIIL